MRWPFSKSKQRSQAEPGPRRPVPSGRRGLDAGTMGRLTASWTGTDASINAILQTQLPRVVKRSRDLCFNNDYAKRFLHMTQTHVVGPNGFTLNLHVTETTAKGVEIEDELAGKAILKAWTEWCKKEHCDVTGRQSFAGICKQYITAVARDGEPLVRQIPGAGKFGLQLQVLATDRLDVNKNEILGNGNTIRMGVELSPFSRPVAYHIRSRHPGDQFYGHAPVYTYERVPAEEVYHDFIPIADEQCRGVPWMHTAMLRLHNLGGYEESAIVAARVGAAKMGFFTTPDGQAQALGDEVEEDGDVIQEAEPGTFDVLPEGYDFTPFNPDYPHQMYDSFVKCCLRGIASGVNVSYNTFANDLEGVNFSSIRTGVLEERDNWMVLQNWMIEGFVSRVFSTWLLWALMKKEIKMPNGSALPVSKFDKFNVGVFKGRRWQWVDPTKDQQANVLAIANHLKTRRQVIEEQGGDADEVFAQLATEKKKLTELGLWVETPPPGPDGTGKKPDDSAPEDADKKKEKEGADA